MGVGLGVVIGADVGEGVGAGDAVGVGVEVGWGVAFSPVQEVTNRRRRVAANRTENVLILVVSMVKSGILAQRPKG